MWGKWRGRAPRVSLQSASFPSLSLLTSRSQHATKCGRARRSPIRRRPLYRPAGAAKPLRACAVVALLAGPVSAASADDCVASPLLQQRFLNLALDICRGMEHIHSRGALPPTRYSRCLTFSTAWPHHRVPLAFQRRRSSGLGSTQRPCHQRRTRQGVLRAPWGLQCETLRPGHHLTPFLSRKVCDFGHALRAADVDQHTWKPEKIAMRWSAPETLTGGRASFATDVW